jgi:hypothetical protein
VRCPASASACNHNGGMKAIPPDAVLINAQVESLSLDSIAVYPGSSEPLHYSVLAFISPSPLMSPPIPAMKPA